LIVQNSGGGGLTCELLVAPTAISKRKVTLLPAEGLIALYESTPMASRSLGLLCENLGARVAQYLSVVSMQRRNPAWHLHSYFPCLVSHGSLLPILLLY